MEKGRGGGDITTILHPECPEGLLAPVNLNMWGRGKMSPPCLQILAGCLILDTNVIPATQDPDKAAKSPFRSIFLCLRAVNLPIKLGVTRVPVLLDALSVENQLHGLGLGY